MALELRRTKQSMPRRSVRLVFRAAIGLAMAAAGTTPVAAAPAGGSVVEAGHVCRDTVGLTPTGRSFSECVEALSQSAVSLRRADALNKAHERCLGQGYRPGDAAMAKCEVTATDEAIAVDARPQDARVTPSAATAIRSYFNVSWQEAHQRQRMACASLGFSPETSGFYNCVAGLQAALFRADHPTN